MVRQRGELRHLVVGRPRSLPCRCRDTCRRSASPAPPDTVQEDREVARALEGTRVYGKGVVVHDVVDLLGLRPATPFRCSVVFVPDGPLSTERGRALERMYTLVFATTAVTELCRDRVDTAEVVGDRECPVERAGRIRLHSRASVLVRSSNPVTERLPTIVVH